ncbi:carbohydrate-binding module family 13 protein [Rhizophagus irregularis DAOM 181602=DAOM 197198]|nr:carbohydrate-binding module family 13 protein [Rhizophagus irregularis DAOM 181602=DAOM 197198]
MDDNKLLPKLLQNLLEILDDEEYYDITIEVGNDPHKNDGTLTHIKLPNFSPEIFHIILRYIYGGKLSLKEYDTPDVIKILVDAKKILFTIIQSDNLQMSEIQIWEHVLKWSLAQNPELPSNLTDYSNDDFNNLKSTLQQYIPYINFYNLTAKEFLDKVFPYEKIFPEDLYKDLLRVFLSLSDPNSKPNDKSESGTTKESKRTIDSKIITQQHVELISKWIDRLEVTDKLVSSYEFKLIFRASRDGHFRYKFHEICDNQPRTITLVKVKDSSEILGGYNPLEWKSDSKDYSATKDSFIFSFNDNDSYILSRVIDEKEAIYNSNFYGPTFGANDLNIWSWRGNRCKKSSYESPIRKTEEKFTVEECEVFQIVCD